MGDTTDRSPRRRMYRRKRQEKREQDTKRRLQELTRENSRRYIK